MIFNPPQMNSTADSSERAKAGLDMNKLIPVFVAQLRELLGVPHVVSTTTCSAAVCSVWMLSECTSNDHWMVLLFPDAAVRSHY